MMEFEKYKDEEEEEEISEPEERVLEEHVPTEWDQFAPETERESVGIERRIVRQPVVEVSLRKVYRKLDIREEVEKKADIAERRIVDEELVAEPTGDVVFEEEYPDNVDIWSEPVAEPEPEEEETVITTRRQVFRRKVPEEPPTVMEFEKYKDEEEEEEISEPEERVLEEHVPTEWDQFAPETERESVGIERRIVRQPVVEVSSRKVYRKLDIREEVEKKADIAERRIVDEELVAEPTGDVVFEEEYPDNVDIWSEPVAEPEPEEEEVEKEETVVTTRRQVFRRKVPDEPPAVAELDRVEDIEEVLPPPRRVERLYVRRILRKADGSETLLEKSESVVPFDSIAVSEVEDGKVGDEKEEDSARGIVVRKVIRRPLFLTSQRTVVRRVEIGEDGGEREVGHDVLEADKDVETTEPVVTHRTVRRVVGKAGGEEIDERVPLEIVRTDRPEGEEAEEEIEGEVKRIVRRRSITRTQRRVVRRMIEKDDGSEEDVEDEIMLPVEAVGYRVVRRRIVKADKTEEVVRRAEYELPLTEETRESIAEVKDEVSGRERKVIRRPVPVVTVRRVYRTIIITESGEEMGSEEEVEEEDVPVVEEEPGAEVTGPKEPMEEVRRVERREADIVTSRQVFRRVTRRTVDDREEEEIPVPEPGEVVLDLETMPDMLPGEEETEDSGEGESIDKLRRVVRRPVHVTSRRTVIRKFVAATADEETGEYEEEEDEDRGETVYARRVVVRRAVAEKVEKDAEIEEERISEPEERVLEEHVPTEWDQFAPETERESVGIERRIVRQPVVEVSSRKVYRKLDIREEVEKKADIAERRIVDEELVAEPTGDVVFEEEYPDNVDIWSEPVAEPEPEEEETVITTRRQVFRRKVPEEPPTVMEFEKYKDEEEEEEISEPEERVLEEHVPTEWDQFAPETERESVGIERRIVRQPVVEVSSRKVYRKLDIREEVEKKADIAERRIVDEELVAEPTGDVVFEEEYPDNVDIWSEPVAEPEPEEEEVEKEETVVTTRRQVFRRKVPDEPPAVAELDRVEDIEEVLPPPRRVERLYVRRILRKADGSETLLEKSESVVPFDSIAVSEVEDGKVGDEKEEDSARGIVVRKVIRRPLFLTSQRTVVRRVEIGEDGGEREVGHDVLEADKDVETTEPVVTHRTVRRVVGKAGGEEIDERVPLEIVRTDRPEGEEAEEEIEGEVKRIVRRRSITRTQRRVVRRMIEKDDGSEEDVEDEIMLPVEAVGYRVVRRRIVKADKTEEVVRRAEYELPLTEETRESIAEVKDEVSGRERKVIRRPVPVVTVRRVYRTIIITESGEEMGSEEEVEEEDVPVVEEEPGAEVTGPKEPMEEVRRVERREADIVTSRQVFRRVTRRTADDREEEEIPVPEPGEVVLDLETMPDMLPGEEETEDSGEGESIDKLRRVVRRPVHVTSRRTVIRKFVAATADEETGEYEEEEDEDRGETVYARRVVVRRAVAEKVEKDAEIEEERISEPEERVLEEHVPTEWDQFAPETERESVGIERRIVRQPVVEVSSRKVYRKLDIREEVEKKADIAERRIVDEELVAEPTGDVVFEEEYPDNVDIWSEPVAEPEPEEEETVITTRRQVFRRKVPEEPPTVMEFEKYKDEEEEEEISEPEERVLEEHVPTEWDQFAPETERESVGIERRIVRQPVVEVSSRKVYRKLDIREEVEKKADIAERRIVDEELVAEPTGDVVFEEEYPDNVDIWSEPVAEPEPEEEEVEKEETVVTTRRQVFRRKVPDEPPAVAELDRVEDIEEVLPPPRRVERLYVRRILRKADGSETLLEKSESVVPFDSIAVSEVEDGKVGDEKEEDSARGIVVRKVIRRPLFLTSQRTVVRRVEIGEDGGEREVGHDVLEADKDVETTEPVVTHRTVRRVVGKAGGEEIDERVPLEIVRTDRPEGEEAEEEIEGEVKRIVRRRSITRTQRRVVRRMIEKDDGSEEDVEDEIMLPVEAVGYRVVRRRIVKADKTEEVVRRAEYELPLTEETRESIAEVKDEVSGRERKVIRRPVPVVTVRRVYRTIIITESGEEMGSEEEVEEEDVPVVEEEPGAEVTGPKEPMEEVRRVERREADIVTSRQVFRRVTRRTADDREEEEIPVPEPGEVVLDLETMPDMLPGEEETEDSGEGESIDKLRRVVRRPVHVTSRRTVIRKFVAATADEETGEYEEEEDEDRGETVYARRVVVRRAVAEKVEKDAEIEEERISEPEERVLEEHVPTEWDQFAPETERESVGIERRIVRQPVVEVSSRKVYRKLDIREEVEKKADIAERRIVDEELVAEPTGDVVFEEEYPDNVDIWSEPVAEPEPEEEETVITTRRQVFRRKVPEEPPTVMEFEKYKDEEEEEEISEPEERVLEEHVPTEWDQFAPETERESVGIERRIVRQPVVEVSSRKVYRKLDIREEVEKKADIAERRIVDEELVAEPTGDVVFEEEYPDNVDIWSEPVAEPEPEEEEVEKEETVVTTRRQVFRRKVPDEPPAVAELDRVEDIEEVLPPPRRVERLYVRRILRKADGSETLLEKSESVVPFDSIAVSEVEDGKVGDEKEEDSARGIVVRKVIRRPLFLTSQRTVVRRVEIGEDGGEREVGHDVLEADKDVETTEPVVTHRTVRRVVGKAGGEEIDERVPLEIVRTDRPEGEEAEEEIEGEVKRIVRRRSITRTQRRVVRRMIEKDDGSEEDVEDEIMLPVEAVGYRVVRRRIVKADKTEEVVRRAEYELPLTEETRESIAEVKDEVSGRERKVIRRPVPVVTVRRVYRTIIITESGEEMGSEEEVEEEDVPVVEEEPGAEVTGPKEPMEEVRRVERREADIVTSRQVFRRVTRRTADDREEEEIPVPEPGEVVLDLETMPDMLPGEEETEDSGEGESIDKLRRVVRRPVHVTSRRTVIRKFVAATADEETGEYEEEEDEDRGETVYARRVVVRRAVAEKVEKDAEIEEERISEPEERVLEEHVPTEWDQFAPETERESVGIERRIVRQPVVEVSSRKVYRKLDIREEVEKKADIAERRIVDEELVAEPTGDVVFEEEYPDNVDIWSEPVAEPEPEEEETVITTRRQVFRRKVPEEPPTVMEFEKYKDEEEEEEISEPEERVLEEHVPTEWDQFAPETERESVGIERRIVRQPVVEVSSRKVYRKLDIREEVEKKADIAERRIVDEELVAEPTGDVVFEEEYPDNVDIWSEPVAEPEPEEEEVEKEETVVTTRRQVFRRKVPDEPPAVAELDRVEDIEEVLPPPRRVERLYVRRILRKADGSETLLEKSESVVPFDSIAVSEVEDGKVGDEKEEDSARGIVVRKVIRRPLFLTSQRTVVRRVEIGEDGGEREVGHDVLEADKDVETTEPVVTHRTVRRVVGKAGGEEIDERVPLEIVRTDRPEGEEAEEEIEGEVKRIVRRRSITRTQRRVVRRMIEKDDGSEEDVEDEIMLPVEAVGYRVVRRRIVKADKTEEVVRRAEYELPLTEETRESIAEVKDEVSGRERKVIRRPVPVVTVRRVYRTIIITESGEEMGSEEEVEEEDVPVVEEEPGAEVTGPKEPMEEVRRVERREADIVTSRQVFRRVTRRTADDREEEEIPVPEPGEVVLDLETMPDMLPGEEETEDSGEGESIDKLRRVVRRPVHVTSRRTVIRKFVAATADEETGEYEEEEDEDRGETVYARRVVVRRAVAEKVEKDAEIEEERISEPEERVLEEHVPTEWDQFAPETERESVGIERRIVRQPVVEVSSRKVYRKLDIREEVEKKADIAERRIVDEELVAEPTGDVVFEEEYPDNVDIWSEPVAEPEPEEEETVITTRRQVFRRKVPEEPPTVMEFEKYKDEEEEEEISEPEERVLEEHVPTEWDQFAPETERESVGIERRIVRQPVVEVSSRKVYRKLDIREEVEKKADIAERRIVDEELVAEPTGDVVFEEEYPDNVDIWSEPVAEPEPEEEEVEKEETVVTTRRQVFRRKVPDEPPAVAELDRVEDIEEVLPPPRRAGEIGECGAI